MCLCDTFCTRSEIILISHVPWLKLHPENTFQGGMLGNLCEGLDGPEALQKSLGREHLEKGAAGGRSNKYAIRPFGGSSEWLDRLLACP